MPGSWRRWVAPMGRRIEELSYLDLQTRDDSTEAYAVRRYWKGHYFRELPFAAIEALLATHPPTCGPSLQAYGGAIADVPDDETAFSQRDTTFEYVGAARWTDPDEDATRIADRAGSAAPPGALRQRGLRQRARRRRTPPAYGGPIHPRSWPGSPPSRASSTRATSST